MVGLPGRGRTEVTLKFQRDCLDDRSQESEILSLDGDPLSAAIGSDVLTGGSSVPGAWGI